MDRLERGVFTPFTAERNRLVAAVAAIERRDASVELLRSAQATLLSRKTKLAVQRANRSAGSGSALDGVNAARAAEGMSLVRGAQQQQQRWCGRTAACAWGDATIVCVCAAAGGRPDRPREAAGDVDNGHAAERADGSGRGAPARAREPAN